MIAQSHKPVHGTAVMCRLLQGLQGAHVVCLGAGARDTLMHLILLRAAAGKDSAAAWVPNTDMVTLFWPSLSLDQLCAGTAHGK